MSYQGWKNWATWNVVLWVDNEEALYRARIAEKPRLAAECEAFARKAFPHGTPDMRREPRGEQLKDVDWTEIADHWAEDYAERA